jgi:hypothetical protein
MRNVFELERNVPELERDKKQQYGTALSAISMPLGSYRSSHPGTLPQ